MPEALSCSRELDIVNVCGCDEKRRKVMQSTGRDDDGVGGETEFGGLAATR